jgi:hypothetical protein
VALNRRKIEGKHVNKKILGSVIAIVVVCALVLFLVAPSLAPPQGTPQELDFTVSGTNDCLRFLNSTVSVCYVPIATGANENWQLTINCTKMPGGANGWTDVYIYKGYWDKGTDYKCMSEDLYPIIQDIESADAQIRGSTPFTASFGGSAPQSYTVIFIFPPGGQATFHVTLKQV